MNKKPEPDDFHAKTGHVLPLWRIQTVKKDCRVCLCKWHEAEQEKKEFMLFHYGEGVLHYSTADMIINQSHGPIKYFGISSIVKIFTS